MGKTIIKSIDIEFELEVAQARAATGNNKHQTPSQNE
jgi:hypothetical protein